MKGGGSRISVRENMFAEVAGVLAIVLLVWFLFSCFFKMFFFLKPTCKDNVVDHRQVTNVLAQTNATRVRAHLHALVCCHQENRKDLGRTLEWHDA